MCIRDRIHCPETAGLLHDPPSQQTHQPHPSRHAGTPLPNYATWHWDLKKVRNLQKLMLRSRANALASVRRVTEINAGRKTAGVDGRLVVDDQDKAEMAAWLQHGAAAWTPRPVKRVFIPKAGGKRRGLGIPVIADRCLQALTVTALEPEWEARFESRSYGFRPGRSCQDAMQSIFA